MVLSIINSVSVAFLVCHDCHRLGTANGVPRAVDGLQGRGWLLEPCASATSSPDGLARSDASRFSLCRASFDASSRASWALRQGVGDHRWVV